MNTANREERLQIMFEHEELRAVDDFRFNTPSSRAAAVRELLKRAWQAIPLGRLTITLVPRIHRH